MNIKFKQISYHSMPFKFKTQKWDCMNIFCFTVVGLFKKIGESTWYTCTWFY